MNKFKPVIYLLMLLNLNISCVQTETDKGNNIVTQTNNAELSSNTQTDTLKFTSGIRAIFQDSKGNYWLGSLQEGVAVYNGTFFTYFTTNEGMSDNQIRSIQEDKNGIIWLNTQKGVNSWNGQNITARTDDGTLQSQWMKSDTDLWFGAGIKEGVYRYDGQKLNYLAFPTKIINPNNLYGVTDLSKGKNNMLWIGTYAGVFGYDGKDFTIINDETLGFDIQKEPLHIRSILEDSKGRLWIGNNGIGLLLKEGDAIINFSEKNNLIHPTSTRRGDKSEAGTLEHVFSIEEDSEGNIWFGDRDTGVWRYDGKNMTNYTIDSKLSTPMVWSIYKDNNNNLLFGMADGGVYKFNGKTFDKMF